MSSIDVTVDYLDTGDLAFGPLQIGGVEFEPDPTLLAYITLIDSLGGNSVLVHYSGSITAASFTPSTFQNTTLGDPGISVSQFAASQLQLTFTLTPSVGQGITYSGSVLNVLTPQTVAIS